VEATTRRPRLAFAGKWLDVQSLQPFAEEVLNAAVRHDADRDIRGEISRELSNVVEKRRGDLANVDDGQGTGGTAVCVGSCLEDGL
jgi:hypothetical protein